MKLKIDMFAFYVCFLIIFLNSIKNHYPKFLITMDNIPNVSHNGIKQIYALDWLLA